MAAEKDGSSKVAQGAKYHPRLPGPKALGLVDVFLFLLDARIPATSLRLTEPYLAKKRRVYVLTKPDLAVAERTSAWIAYFESQGVSAFAVDARTGKGVGALMAHLKEKRDEKSESRPLRAMLFGLPNVGKSSLANRLLGVQKAPYGAKPGLTRASSWIRGNTFIELLDTPGVADASQVKGDARMKLAATWAIPDTAFDAQEVAWWLATNFVAPGVNPEEYLTEFALSRGFLARGGVPDLERASWAFVKAFRGGALGRYTLEIPGSVEEGPVAKSDNPDGGV